MTSDVETFRDDIERPAGGIGFPRTLRRLVQGKNIHQDTLLATDYLNHFNEIAMLLELVADMPDCLEDALDWAPKSYEDHFSQSSFQDKALAILAYENAPRRYREPFDQLVAQMDATIVSALKRLSAAAEDADPEQIRLFTTQVTTKLQRFVDVASAVIHGRVETSGQAEIDTMLSEIEEDDNAAPPETSTSLPPVALGAQGPGENPTSQADIDALFD
jgi:hypothetical protein